jgi:hypothetical protein
MKLADLQRAAARSGNAAAFAKMNAGKFGKPAKPKARGMNAWEREYANQLEMLRRAGEIEWWGFEPIRLRLGKGAWFTPDFCVAYPSGALVFYEVKGWFREAAKVRIKVAASLYPMFGFVVARKVSGEWIHVEVPT